MQDAEWTGESFTSRFKDDWVPTEHHRGDLHPDTVSNIQMGYIFEELIRWFSEQSNETAGEHFTPREVIRLMVNLLFQEDNDVLTKKGIIRKLYDPACGTGGMLSVAEDYLRELNTDAHLEVYGQELNDESYGARVSDGSLLFLQHMISKFNRGRGTHRCSLRLHL